MNHTMMSAAGCLLLLAAAMAPAVLGHDDLLYSNGTSHRYPTPHDESGVNGNWHGPSGLCVTFDGPTVDQPPLAPIDPDFSACSGLMLCDMEVLGTGTSPQESDEIWIDGTGPHSPNSVPDGTFDDGGLGGACHTNHYDYEPYNSPGCEDAAARANNIAPLAAPTVGASCDWKTVEGGTPQSDILLLCILNAVLSSDATQVPGELVACVVDFLECFTGPVPCDADGVETCGPDAVADGINFGPGNTAVPYPHSTPVGQSFTDDGLDCHTMNPSTATMGAFIFDSVTVVDNGLPNPPTVTVNPAVQGSVWQV